MSADQTQASGKTDILESAPSLTVMVQLRGAGHAAASQLRSWSGRPGGRLVIPGLLIAAMLASAGFAGAYVAPKASVRMAKAHPGAAPSPSETEQPSPSDEPLQSAEPVPSGSVDFTPPPVRGGRPADVLAAWAVPMAAKLGIPPVAMQAYAYAELSVKSSQPACNLSWSTLAGIGKIESDHGRAQGATLGADGKALPSIVGPPLDGQNGRKSIPDTDGGQLDGDRSWDRAVGPMQFIPATWKQYAVDADGDGVTDINDIDDAALAAANYLCAGNRNLSTPDGWKAAVGAYNAVDVYIQSVHDAANDYGRRSLA